MSENFKKLKAKNLCKTYNKRKVVDDVSLEVNRGEVVGLLGPNGAGKTTTFYMITGMIKPLSGQIKLDSMEITKMPMYKRALNKIGYLAQESSVFTKLSVEDNIMLVLEMIEPSLENRKERLEELLDEFSIGHIRKSMGYALSGGERRRVEIARCLVPRPNFILLDEPFAGIDPIAVGEIRELVSHLKERGVGVLITDHNVRETLTLIDRAVLIHEGSVLIEGEPSDIVGNEDVRKVYLGDRFSI